VLNNPLKYTDPTGHCISIDGEHTCGSGNTAPRYDPPKKDKKESKKDKGSSIIDLYILVLQRKVDSEKQGNLS
jgi:hypothetical protein